MLPGTDTNITEDHVTIHVRLRVSGFTLSASGQVVAVGCPLITAWTDADVYFDNQFDLDELVGEFIKL